MVSENLSGSLRAKIVVVSVVFGPVYRYHVVPCNLYISVHNITAVHSPIHQTITNEIRYTLCQVLF